MNVAEPYKPVQYHWFFNQQVDSKDSWQPFSREDSQRLEDAYSRVGKSEKDEEVVATDGRRYDVRLRERKRYSVYWEQKPTEVRRCSWFYKGNKDVTYTPYSEELSDFLEDAYMIAVTLDEWKTNLELPSGETVILHNPKLMTQYPSSCKDFPPSPSERSQPMTLKRGIENIPVEIPEGEPEIVDHLVFMVHGIGPACDIRLRGIVQCVNEFRNASNGLINSHFRQSEQSCIIGRVEYLPVNWHKVLHGETIGVDKDIERITLPSISRLRQFSNDTVLDLFFYNSATYCQTIVDTVASEINRLHSLFLQRHPHFTGHVSLVGHSLGSLILFDLLTNQETSADATTHELHKDPHVDSGCSSYDSLEESLKSHGLEEHLNTLQREQVDMESLVSFLSSDFECPISRLNICGPVSPIEHEEGNFAKVGMLNRGRRIDFVLQEKDVEEDPASKLPHRVHHATDEEKLASTVMGQKDGPEELPDCTKTTTCTKIVQLASLSLPGKNSSPLFCTAADNSSVLITAAVWQDCVLSYVVDEVH